MIAAITVGLALWQSALAPAQASIDLARALVDAGKFQDAREVLAKLDPSSPVVLHLNGVVLFNSREYAPAVEALKRSIEFEPAGSALRRESAQLIARSLYYSGKFADAIPWLERARESASDPAEIAYMLSTALLKTLQPERARPSFAQLYGVAPESAAAHLITAQFLLRQDLENEAAQYARRALELDPKLPGAHFLLGEIAIYRAQLDPAIAELKSEIALNPSFAMSYYRLGDAYTRREEWAEAIPHLERSVWLNPFFSGPYILLGKAYLKRSQLGNAEGVLRRALQMDPQNSSAHYLLGQTLQQMGRTDDARQELRRSQDVKKDAAQ